MSEQAQKDVWEDDPDALLTSSWAPDGIATLKPESVVELPEMAAVYFMARNWAHLALET